MEEKKPLSDEKKVEAAKKAAAARKAAMEKKAAEESKPAAEKKPAAKEAAPEKKAAAEKKPAAKEAAPEKKTTAEKKVAAEKKPAAEAEEAPKAEAKPAKKPAAEAAPKAPKAEAKPAAASGQSVKGLRIAAIVMWVLALGAEVWAFIELHQLAVMSVLNEEADLAALLAYPQAKLFLLALVLDLILCIVAAQLWKKSNRIRPCLSNSALVRTLWHQLGVIMALICLIPLGIFLLLKTKNLNPKVRTILLVAFAALLVGATTASVDYQQPSKEEVAQLQAEAEAEAAAAGIDMVYWTKYGKSYHFDRNCRSLARSNPENIGEGSLDDAFDHNRWDPCNFCAGGNIDLDAVSAKDVAEAVQDSVDTAQDLVEQAEEQLAPAA